MQRSNIKACRWLGSALIALSIAAASSFITQEGSANSAPSVEKLEKAIAALEARVAALAPLKARVDALEERLQQYEGNATSQEAQASTTPRPLLVSLSADEVRFDPMLVAPQAQPVSLPQEYKWSGLY